MSISFNDFLKKAGGTSKDVQTVEASTETAQPAKEPNFLSRVISDVKQRGENVANQADRNQGMVSDTLQFLGQGAGVANDVIGEGLKSLGKVTGITDNVIKPTLSSILSTDIGKKGVQAIESGMESYNQFKKENPVVANNLEAVLNIGALLPVGKATELGGKVLKTGVSTAGEASKVLAKEASPILKTIGEKTTGLVVKMEEPTKLALQSYEASQPSLFNRVKNIFTGEKPQANGLTKPITEANTAVRLVEPGTEWQVGVNAKRVSQDLWKQTIEPAIKQSKNVNNMQEFISNIKNRVISETKDLDRRKVLLKALDSFSEDYKAVRNFSDSKLQQYKEGWARFVPEKTYKGEPIAAASKEIRAIAADEARQRLYNILPSGKAKQAYIDYGNLQSLAEGGIKSVEGLTDKSFSRKIYEALIDKAVTPVATIAGKILYKTGEGLEFIGNRGAKKVKDILKQ